MCAPMQGLCRCLGMDTLKATACRPGSPCTARYLAHQPITSGTVPATAHPSPEQLLQLAPQRLCHLFCLGRCWRPAADWLLAPLPWERLRLWWTRALRCSDAGAHTTPLHCP